MAVLLFVPAGAAAAEPTGQCGKPVAERVGNWYCPASGASGLQQQQPGFCNVSGCYRRYSDYRADWASAPGTWGHGGRVLGSAEFEATWQLTGPQMVSSPVRYRNSVDTVNVAFEGLLLNAAPGRLGAPVEGTFAPYMAGPVPGGTMRSWQPNGYSSYDREMWDHVHVITFSWQHPEVPGTWYAYVKSLNATSVDKSDYRFRGVDELPADAGSGGYRP